eukprot:1476391-Amphidinium_carterae.1
MKNYERLLTKSNPLLCALSNIGLRTSCVVNVYVDSVRMMPRCALQDEMRGRDKNGTKMRWSKDKKDWPNAQDWHPF